MRRERSGEHTSERRWRLVVPVVGAVVVAVVVGWLAVRGGGSGGASSPGGDGAGDVVTVPVERRVLESLQVTRGSVIAPSQAEVQAGMPAEGELGVVVTEVPLARGAEIVAGATVVELNGRPVFALPGTIPVYRDLRPGDSGPDVAALQVALAASGHEITQWEREEELFGWGTRTAVERLYRDAGYEPVYTLGSRDAVVQAQSQADGAVADARSALEAARASAPADVPSAEQALADAESARERVRASEGVVLPAREYVAVPVLPAVLVDLPVALGQQVEPGAPVAKIGSSKFRVRIELTSAQVNELADDVEIAVLSDDGYEATCARGELRPAEAPEGPDDAEPGSEAEEPVPDVVTSSDGQVMDVSCDPLPPPESLGADVRVTMTVRRSEGEALVVPATAVATASSGDAFVEVVGRDGEATRVVVVVGGEADGFVEVTAVDGGGALDEGVDVRVRRG